MTDRSAPNPTWADVKQIAWAWLMVLPFIALVTYGARELLGWRTALWMGVGLVALMTAAFVLIVGVSLAVSFGYECARRVRQRWNATHARRGRGAR